jgi:CRISPR/Cas system CMR-associated protein Cmr5 small subunit
MLKVIDAKTRVNSKTKEEYNIVELQGNVEIQKSQSSGKFYLGSKTISVPTTLNLNEAKLLIGTFIPGKIEKIDCAEYLVPIPNSNKKLKITHTFAYAPAVADEVTK